MTENITETKEIKPEQPQTSVPPIRYPRKPISRHIVFVCGMIALLLLGFIGGQAFERARFRHFTRWQNNYERNFIGDRSRAPRGIMQQSVPGGPLRSHAILGTILSVNGSVISVQDNNDNIEQAINVLNSTIIQKNSGRGSIVDLQQGQKIAIFGRPANNGQIDASLIRILNTTTATPAPSAGTSPINQPKN